MAKIILTADSTCDLTPELKEKFRVAAYTPLHIIVAQKSYDDGVNITPQEIYKQFDAVGTLPKTAAVNVGEYTDFFKRFTNQGYTVIHINIGSALSSSYQNACKAAEEIGNVYPVDSCNLSTGTAHIVIEASDMIKQGLEADDIVERLKLLTKKVHSSFIINKLNYLRAGGRCSALAVLGANILQLKPCIEVNNRDGSMTVGKKYRGKLDSVLLQYVDEKLSSYDNIRYDKIFITHAGIGDDHVKTVFDHIKNKNLFENIYITTASCTISSHCGPGTLGILFMTE